MCTQGAMLPRSVSPQSCSSVLPLSTLVIGTWFLHDQNGGRAGPDVRNVTETMRAARASPTISQAAAAISLSPTYDIDPTVADITARVLRLAVGEADGTTALDSATMRPQTPRCV